MSAASMSGGRTHVVVTPEGVPLRFTVAGGGARLVAFAIDLMVVAAIMFILFWAVLGLAFAARGTGASGVVLGISIVLWFLLVNFYWPFYEIRGQGATPGKKALRLRVIDRRGAPLTAGAIFARNLTRDVELWIPAQLLVFGRAMMMDSPIWFFFVVTAGAVVLVAFPLFNRDRLRLGDVFAGTLVVEAPRPSLLRDLAAAPDGRAETSPYVFTPEQLDIYGIYELQVLEALLRQGRSADPRGLRTVHDRIRKKIGWRPPPGLKVDVREFLESFYRAQRSRLEDKLLLGRRQERKRDTGDETRVS